MHAFHALRFAMPVLVPLLVSAAGCAPKAMLTVWEPAELNISGVRTLAVLDFRGEYHSGQIARSALVSQLVENGFYTLVDQDQLPGLRRLGSGQPGEPIDVNSAVDAARAAGVDAILVGDVLSYHAVDDVDNRPRIGVFNGVEADQQGTAGPVIGIGIQTGESIHREISAALAFQLIESRGGQILAARQSSYTVTGQAVNGEGYLPARERTLTELMARCAADVVRMIAPHRVPVEVQLATALYGPGAKQVQAGNKLAMEGHWDKAAEEWQKALDQDRGCHAAKYNLALAHTQSGRLTDARRLLIDASVSKPRGLYRRALAQFDHQQEKYRLAMEQFNRRPGPPPDPGQPVAGPASPPAGPVAPPAGPPQDGAIASRPPSEPPLVAPMAVRTNFPAGYDPEGAGR